MNIDLLFTIKGIAVIGASPGTYFSDRLFENLEGLRGRVPVFPVNAGKKSVYRMKCYPSLRPLAGKCSLAFLLVEEGKAVAALEECAGAGVKAAVMLSPAEKDPEVASRAGKAARLSDMLLLGPGSMGVIDAHAGLTLYSGRLPGGPLPRGRVSVIAESGGLLNEFFRSCFGEMRWGMRRAVSVGQQGGLSTGDLLRQMALDPMTGCVALLLTGMKDKAGLVAAIEEVSLTGKPVVVFPAFLRRGAVGRRLQEEKIEGPLFDELFITAAAARGNLFMAGSAGEAAEAAGALAPGGAERAGEGIDGRWKKIRGRKLAVVSVSGGIGQWIRTRALERGLEVPAFSRKLKEELSSVFQGASFSNPVDLSGRILSSPGHFRKVLGAILRSKACHVLVAAIHAPSGDTPSDRRNETWLDEMADIELQGLRDDSAALVPVQVGDGGPPPGKGSWSRARPVRGIDLALDLILWARGFEKTDRPGERKERPGGADFEAVRSILRGPARRLSEPSSRRVLAAYGIEFNEWILASSPSRASAFAGKLGAPVAMTLASPDAAQGGTGPLRREDIRGEAAARKACVDLLVSAKQGGGDMRILGVLVEPFEKGLEAVPVETVSSCDGAPPLLLAGGEGDGKLVAGICPPGPREALVIAQGSLERLGAKLEPVKMAGLLGRLALLASDFREEIRRVRCRFAADGHGRIVCTSAEVEIAREL